MMPRRKVYRKRSHLKIKTDFRLHNKVEDIEKLLALINLEYRRLIKIHQKAKFL